jgi:glutaredoxin 3
VPFVEIDLWQDSGRRDEMIRRAGGRRTVPQIFIDGRPIGGSDELVALHREGSLAGLIAGDGSCDS